MLWPDLLCLKIVLKRGAANEHLMSCFADQIAHRVERAARQFESGLEVFQQCLWSDPRVRQSRS